ncbi:DNA polymerase III subunit alpha [Candidatus Pantoea edessiphila]|uniref:DNA polymerase III subunit alpha n=1 Tax=Candidatus Pantoea edessiphila TaxID=2044610 RepID=A0A2P5SWD3_9GAMM|nr:DNA polymerase III subunit alpha [Candidatus Pantoea edessiphila]PPI86632.1 DNA polymerase III subunit alpha [Candidatus Pantoea edessiphila]
MTTEPRFIHLNVHSDYSMIDGLIKIKSLVENTYLLGMPAVAITDFTNLCGLIKFYHFSHKMGLKPIIGTYFKINNKLLGKNLSKITVLASNNIGYQNLILLISRAYKRGYGISGPTIDLDWLSELQEGLIILSGGCYGDVGRALLLNEKSLVLKCLDFYKKNFTDRYYLELIRTGRPNEENYLKKAIKISISENLPVVATNEVCFLNKEDFYAHEIRVAINKGYTINDPKRPCDYSSQQYMRSEDEMCELFSDIPEALKNSVEIAKRCNVTLKTGRYFLPKFNTNGVNPQDFLVIKAKSGLNNRLKYLFKDEIERNIKRVEYDKRLENELDIINKTGFPSYFLIVMEFIQWTKDNDIPVGPGRGSGAGSLVAYSLKITDLDPIKFDLLFERFLNPERISMPDFDIDFCMENRDKVIEHVTNMYGQESVSQIITFGTMAAKAVVRDVGRVLEYPYGFIDKIAKLIPSDPGITLEKAFAIEKTLLNMYDTDEETKILIDTARKLEGITRNIGKHAGGVVIAPTKITDFVPVYCDEHGSNPITQFDKNDVEYIGLVKFDFLGLKTLTIINWATIIINVHNKKQNKSLININNISLNDKISFDILQRAETTAVFQLESRGMKDLIKRLKPDCFEDIIALVALFRPGPLQSGMVENFINRKHGKEIIYYPDIKWQHQSLKPILESTYGIILYQEQVMQIAKVLAGYTPGKADILRRAMGKKNPNEMSKQRSVFKEGAKNAGIQSDLAMKIFDLLEKFAGYGFNKSHSAAYALLSYQTLWLKAHYPAEFMAAAMTADMDNIEKIVGLVEECSRMQIKVLPPSINFSVYEFHVNDKKEILYGMGAIKGLGKTHIKMIIDIRSKKGYFKDFFDFCECMTIKKINRRTIEKLIMCGALDSLCSNRSAMINSINEAIKISNQNIKSQITGQYDMFGINTEQSIKFEKYYKNTTPWSEKRQLDAEKETLGLYLTGHPIHHYIKELDYYSNGIKLNDIFKIQCRQTVSVAGIAIDMKIMLTKRRNRIGICLLDDSHARIEVIFYSEILKKYQVLLKKDHILIIKGQIKTNNIHDKIKKIIAYEVMNIDQARKKYVKGISIFITNEQKYNNKLLNQISQLIAPYCSGNIPVNIYQQENNTKSILNSNKNWFVILNDNLINDLKLLLGNKQVELEFL